MISTEDSVFLQKVMSARFPRNFHNVSCITPPCSSIGLVFYYNKVLYRAVAEKKKRAIFVNSSVFFICNSTSFRKKIMPAAVSSVYAQP